MLPELNALGIAVHAVTAESGGEEVTRRLLERDTPLNFKVHSDPEHMLLVHSEEEFYLKELHKASKYGGTYTDYNMVQPALVVIDKAGAFQQVWSWMTPPLKDVQPKEALTRVPGQGGFVLVGVRPDSADLALSIKEGRNVRLNVRSLPTILVEKFGLPKLVGASSFIFVLLALIVTLIRRRGRL